MRLLLIKYGNIVLTTTTNPRVRTGLVVELEHLKIETRLINATFANAMG